MNRLDNSSDIERQYLELQYPSAQNLFDEEGSHNEIRNTIKVLQEPLHDWNTSQTVVYRLFIERYGQEVRKLVDYELEPGYLQSYVVTLIDKTDNFQYDIGLLNDTEAKKAILTFFNDVWETTNKKYAQIRAEALWLLRDNLSMGEFVEKLVRHKTAPTPTVGSMSGIAKKMVQARQKTNENILSELKELFAAGVKFPERTPTKSVTQIENSNKLDLKLPQNRAGLLYDVLHQAGFYGKPTGDYHWNEFSNGHTANGQKINNSSLSKTHKKTKDETLLATAKTLKNLIKQYKFGK